MTDAADTDPAMPDALEIAAELDAKFAATGELVGPLHGIVFALKDQYDTFDMRSTSGADARYADDRAPDDATFVARLRAAGAIVLAKANLGEYASGIPRSSFGGTFCNPYDTERSPLGSSSGSGSAVAANLVTCAIARRNRRVDPQPGARGERRRHRADPRAREPRRHDPSRHQHARRPDLPHRRGRREGAASHRRLRSEGRAHGVRVGRLPAQPYERFARELRLEGLTHRRRARVHGQDAVHGDGPRDDRHRRPRDRDIASLGATIVDPGPNGALFGDCLTRYSPRCSTICSLVNSRTCSRRCGRQADDGDRIATLVAMAQDPVARAAKR